MKISINQLSLDLSIPPNRIGEIVNGKRSISVDTALRLQRYFGVEALFWLNLQAEYDLRMIAFISDYSAEEIVIDGSGIVETTWSSKGNLPKMPSKISIAGQLIDWLSQT